MTVVRLLPASWSLSTPPPAHPVWPLVMLSLQTPLRSRGCNARLCWQRALQRGWGSPSLCTIPGHVVVGGLCSFRIQVLCHMFLWTFFPRPSCLLWENRIYHPTHFLFFHTVASLDAQILSLMSQLSTFAYVACASGATSSKSPPSPLWEPWAQPAANRRVLSGARSSPWKMPNQPPGLAVWQREPGGASTPQGAGPLLGWHRSLSAVGGQWDVQGWLPKGDCGQGPGPCWGPQGEAGLGD